MIKQIIKLPVLSFLLGLTLLIGSANAAWELPPEEFSPAYGGSIDIASDADGNAIVVIDDANTVTVAAFQYTRATNTWTGPTTLANANGFANIALDRDPYGTALAIWIDNINTELHSSYFDGSTWTIGSPDPFATATDVNSYNLDMNGPNTGLAVWIDGGGTNQALSSFFSAGSWSAIPVPIAPSDGVQSAAAYSSNGTAVAGFDNLNALQVSNYNGSVWLSPVTLDPAIAFTSHNIVLGIDSTGKALAVWVNTAGDVKSSTFDGISNWSAAVTISSTSGNDPFTTSISMSPNGTAVATWIDGASTGWSNSYNGTTWNVPQHFSDDAINANVSVNIHGNALVLFTTSTNQLY